MTTPNDGGPAFPIMQYDGWTTSDSDTPRQFHSPVQEGMSLRDWFAGMTLCGLRAQSDADSEGMDYTAFAVTAFKQADAMLKAREK